MRSRGGSEGPSGGGGGGRALLVAFEDVFDVRLEPPAAGDEFAAQCAPFLIPPACDVLLADGAVAGR